MVVDIEKLIGLLQTCRQQKDLRHAMCLLAFTCEHALTSQALVGNHFVPLLVDCGSLPDAQFIFNMLARRNEVSWSSLIMGYVDSGYTQRAFFLYRQMQENAVQPTTYTFLSLLRACVQLKDLETGRNLHSDIMIKGLELDLSVGNTLVDMYGKCGSLDDAHQELDRVPGRDVVSWNALITGYAEHGLGEEALRCFQQMQLERLSPDAVTFVCSLKACGSIGATARGQTLCAEIVKRGLENNVFVGSGMVDMYAKCGLPYEARGVFDRLPVRNVVSWTALITGYVENEHAYEGLHCFEQMQRENFSPNTNTYVSSLKCCSNTGDLERGQQIQCDLIKRGLEQEHFVGNMLVDMYVKCGFLAEAKKVFNTLPIQDAVSWGALISGFAEHGLDEEVLGCFEELMLQGVSVDTSALARCLKSCGNTGAIEVGHEIHAEIRKLGLESNLSVGNTLIDMYGKCGSLADSRRVFDELPVRDVVTWSAMIKAFGENHDGIMAIRCFEQMQEQGVKPDAVTFTCLLVACSHANLYLKGQEYFRLMGDEHNIEPTLDHYSCMVDLLARSGQVQEAEKFLDAMECLSSLTALLNACKLYGKVELARRCFRRLLEVDHKDAAAYFIMVEIYASACRWNDANEIEQMMKDAGTKKKPACASIEVNGKLHGFVPSSNLSKNVLTMLEAVSFHIKGEGYVPELDLMRNNQHLMSL